MTTSGPRQPSVRVPRGAERAALLSRKIKDLSLQIHGTRLEVLVHRLYDEMEKAGLHFPPMVYLSDEWGCPDRAPVIGIPFYLADPVLSRLEGELTGVEAENEAEIMMYLRHEAGHAFNYAYRLYLQPEWQKLFGSIAKAYLEEYRTVPFSTRFVRHVPGWYGQKHPDDDFAETFAVWLTPGSDWQRRYKGTPALAKLEYVNKVAGEVGGQPPVVTGGALDAPVEELEMTLAQWYSRKDSGPTYVLPQILDADLKALFPDKDGVAARELIYGHRRALIRGLNFWTGVSRRVLQTLLGEVLRRVESLQLKVKPEQAAPRMADLAIFLTTLVMNYNYTGTFVER